MKLPNLENWSSGKLSKSANFLSQKSSESFWFFFIEDYEFFVIEIFWYLTSIFKSLYFLKKTPSEFELVNFMLTL